MSVTRGRPIVVAASTHPGEEEHLVQAHRTLAGILPSLLTIIVPRHPDRGGRSRVWSRPPACTRRCARASELPIATTDIYVADTMGELGLFYRLAPIVFMGGSLVEHGGQNPIEAVKLGAAIVHGPHVFNFTDIYAALDAAGGAERPTTQEALVKQLGQLLADPEAREASLAAAERVVEQLGGALERTLAALEPYLLQLRLEMGAAQCVSRPSGTGAASLKSHLFTPLGALYGAVAARRMRRQGLDAGIPVICVGNYHVGGAGKTPTVHGAGETAARARRDAGRAQPRLWRKTARARCRSIRGGMPPPTSATSR